ncbi:SDR family NAD(P)-dependent oxidoreductase [Tetragenococcus halophilus]|uniref:SDR family NAD(P)-dependent oxidoreductase n=1 Tax=Tetragenococcus halophilus TaxID=51669 RepID=UPI00083E5A30|nr:SDR family NAD(P)-dependent oxidoreductase [Tetragenococcus halophilus]AOF48595.1 oxidoreductase [Tetragenococcus halophilus]QXN86083.1 SDR family NAD(P)-dependent oxidoreductase [Tetragenococcus halophilus]RQD32532.1 KR domain-containing protein [Tetragenococcus halophilus subsp. halophilus DSM 20339]WJS81161.1 SDR family NAD(P)-dependent oxidoreductase [Tetragenococcus halophilus]GBD59223.1 putative oxidoreductase [Tetragenococcus halophilus subsp. halophilus]
MKSLSESTVLITGATDGLGKMTAERFAKQGAKVLLHGRNEEKGFKTIEEIQQTTGNQNLKYFNGDFASLQSVAKLAEKIIANSEKIDLLINNAGIGGGPKSQKQRELSQDGYELRWSINYLAQVLLTRKLLPMMKDHARIINVASVGQAPIDFNDINMENHYEGYLAYERSKLALIMFTFDLAAELQKREIHVNALHPSTLMSTNMVSDHFGPAQTSVEKGFSAVEYLTTSKELDEVTGEYFEGKTQAQANAQAYDKAAREKLGQITKDSIANYL